MMQSHVHQRFVNVVHLDDPVPGLADWELIVSSYLNKGQPFTCHKHGSRGGKLGSPPNKGVWIGLVFHNRAAMEQDQNLHVGLIPSQSLFPTYLW